MSSRNVPKMPCDLRVLTAEDDLINQKVMTSILELLGIVSDLVANGAEAFDAWQASDYGLILMDVQMPELDGVGATAAIRGEERRLGLRRTPIIGVTANAEPADIIRYMSCGMDAVVPKPVEVARLVRTMRAALPPETARRTLEFVSEAGRMARP